MRLASFYHAGRASWGTVNGDAVFDAGAVLSSTLPTLKSLLATEHYAVLPGALREAPRVPLTEIRWLPVVPLPGKIICVGVNYEEHRQETGRAAVAYPTLFARYASSQTGHRQNITQPKSSIELDFEGELAVIIGRAGRYIKKSDAMAHIAGFACYNDVTVRDFQRHTSQFTPGKNFDGTGAFGPWMVTPDEMGVIGPQRLQTRLNGQVVQQAQLDQMIFDIPAQIEYISMFTQLEPGDVIVTGTPGGVGARRTPPLWMKPGDVVEVEIENVGVLRNQVIAEV
ncbi:MAG: 5-carboxymethyl-2-hydroxymuconate isomerase [Rhodospirillales bacterium 20-58-10]|nr:MAG: 5-carboxymethyl-2-hydroxymuconate isomerase [Rhodospirillales bacterium 20-58-10]